MTLGGARERTAALTDLNLSARAVFRCRNFFCLGVTSWLYHRPIEVAEGWLRDRFKKTPELVEANVRALRAGQPKGAALRQAQLALLSCEAHPYVWAPFQLVGDRGPLELGVAGESSVTGLVPVGR